MWGPLSLGGTSVIIMPESSSKAIDLLATPSIIGDTESPSNELSRDKVFLNCFTYEDLHLDFKQLQRPFEHRDDKRNLAKALSGFANSDGGIIIWGIDAREKNGEPDCSNGFQYAEFSLYQLVFIFA
jgi:hypothetical protein